MASDKNMPSAYLHYERLKKSIKESPTKRRIHRFAYRFRLAKAFKGIKVDKEFEKSVDGYDVGLKILLAVTAYDEIAPVAKALRVSIAQFGKVSDEATKELRANKKFKKFMMACEHKQDYITKLTHYFDGGTDNAIPVAMAIRNVFAHGEFTPGGAGITKANRKAFLSLANLMLDVSERVYYDCLMELKDPSKIK